MSSVEQRREDLRESLLPPFAQGEPLHYDESYYQRVQRCARVILECDFPDSLGSRSCFWVSEAIGVTSVYSGVKLLEMGLENSEFLKGTGLSIAGGLLMGGGFCLCLGAYKLSHSG
jgi:hypothetical protein